MILPFSQNLKLGKIILKTNFVEKIWSGFPLPIKAEKYDYDYTWQFGYNPFDFSFLVLIQYLA